MRLRRELEAAGERFAGHSDTEGLLYGLSRYGPEYLNRSGRTFVLAFYDARKQELLRRGTRWGSSRCMWRR